MGMDIRGIRNINLFIFLIAGLILVVDVDKILSQVSNPPITGSIP